MLGNTDGLQQIGEALTIGVSLARMSRKGFVILLFGLLVLGLATLYMTMGRNISTESDVAVAEEGSYPSFSYSWSLGNHTLEEVLGWIEDNQGPEGLDLSDRDLSNIDFSPETIQEEVALRAQPAWLSRSEEGLNLKGANLQGAILMSVDLREADLRNANLQGAILIASDLEGANLVGADLAGANLMNTRLQGAKLGFANLEEADLSMARLQGANLWGANLKNAFLESAYLQGAFLVRADLTNVNLLKTTSMEGVYLYGAVLERTNLSSHQLGGAIGEEKDHQYLWAKEAYRALKENFREIGRYGDSSWAYVKERQMAKETHQPLRAKLYYGKSQLAKGESGGMQSYSSLGWFYLYHSLAYLAHWFLELTCLYGRSPFRVLLTSFIAISILSPLYRLSYGISREEIGSPPWSDCFRYSLTAFMGRLPFSRLQSRLDKALAGFEATLGICMFILFIITLSHRIDAL